MRAFLVFLLLFPISAVASPTFQVVFDQSLNQVSSPFDSSFEGMSKLSTLLRARGASVSTNFEPLSKFLDSFKGAGRVLVLGIPVGSGYSDSDLKAVKDFLSSGAGVLAIAEHDNFYGHAVLQNQLLEEYGISIQSKSALASPGDRLDLNSLWPGCEVESWGLKEITLYLPAPLRVTAPAKALVEISQPNDISDAVVGAISMHGAGRLIAIADLEIFWNMTPKLGINGSNNKKFLELLFSKLAGIKRHAELGPGQVEAAPDIKGKSAVFLKDGQALYPESAPNSFNLLEQELRKSGFQVSAAFSHQIPENREIELGILALPLESISPPIDLKKFKQILLIADGRTNFLSTTPQLKELWPKLFAAPDNYYVYPVNQVAESFGLKFLEATLLKDSGFDFGPELSIDGAKVLRIYRSSAISNTDGQAEAGSLKVHARAVTNLHPKMSGDFSAKAELPELDLRTSDTAGRDGWSIVWNNRRVMAVADVELLMDQSLKSANGKIVLKLLVDWLKKGKGG